MKVLLAMAVAFTMAVVLTAAGAGVPAAVHYINHDKFTKGGATIEDPGLRVFVNRRTAAEVELHEHTNHIFIIVDGEATFVTGGTMVNAKRTSPDQMTATDIQGGEVHHLTKGDLITIPAKTPHWWKEVPTKTIAYYAVNIEN